MDACGRLSGAKASFFHMIYRGGMTMEYKIIKHYLKKNIVLIMKNMVLVSKLVWEQRLSKNF